MPKFDSAIQLFCVTVSARVHNVRLLRQYKLWTYVNPVNTIKTAVVIAGMIATGNGPKRVIIRAIGPTLTDFGVPGALSDPTLELFEGSNSVASNDDWRVSNQQAEIEASGLAPAKDAGDEASGGKA